MDKLKYILNCHKKMFPKKRKLFYYFSLTIFPFFLSACAVSSAYILPTMEIINPNTKQNAIIVIGLELSNDDLYSAAISINMNGRIQEAYGNLVKDKNPNTSQSKNINPKILNYTGGGDRGYLVFEFPMNFNEKKSVQCLAYFIGVEFSDVAVPIGTSYSKIGTKKSGEYGWWKNFGFSGKPGWRNIHPIGYIEDPNWTFYGCKFTLEKPGIYYLGDLKLDLSLTVGEKTSDGNVATQKVVWGNKFQTAAIDGNISAINDLQNFKQFLRYNNINEDSFINYSELWKQISQEEYLNFGN
jgi:hypothetical protein